MAGGQINRIKGLRAGRLVPVARFRTGGVVNGRKGLEGLIPRGQEAFKFPCILRAFGTKYRGKGCPLSSLLDLSKVGLLDCFIPQKVPGTALPRYPALLQDIGLVGHRQGLVGVLLHQ